MDMTPENSQKQLEDAVNRRQSPEHRVTPDLSSKRDKNKKDLSSLGYTLLQGFN
jgi:hypothetical protein